MLYYYSRFRWPCKLTFSNRQRSMDNDICSERTHSEGRQVSVTEERMRTKRERVCKANGRQSKPQGRPGETAQLVSIEPEFGPAEPTWNPTMALQIQSLTCMGTSAVHTLCTSAVPIPVHRMTTVHEYTIHLPHTRAHTGPLSNTEKLVHYNVTTLYCHKQVNCKKQKGL